MPVKKPMAGSDLAKIWGLHYKLVGSVIIEIAPSLNELGLEPKELFLLAELDTHPHPAALAETLCIPKPSVTVYLKRLEAAGLVTREIDSSDLRRHKLSLTADGRRMMAQGQGLLMKAFGARIGRLSAARQGELKVLLEQLL
jgi:DNA-binding MarR family transcriptional regulator